MDSAGVLLAHEREAWTREKLRLEKALNLAQTQVARLRAEIRSDTLREITGPEADNAALKVGHYLLTSPFKSTCIRGLSCLTVALRNSTSLLSPAHRGCMGST